MTSRLTALAAVLAAALLAALLPATTASAEIRFFADAAHDVRGRYTNVDVGRVVVQHSHASVRVRLFPARGVENASTFGDGATNLWWDTDASRPGPEYGGVLLYGGARPVIRVFAAYRDSRGFHHRGVARCTLSSATYDRRDKTSESVVPRRCLGYPYTLRVNVTVTDESSTYPNELAPGKQRFGPWTHVG